MTCRERTTAHRWPHARQAAEHYNYFRDYDPAIGRYVESDPIGLDGGLNTFAYVNSSPLSLIDSLGELGSVALNGISRDPLPPGDAAAISNFYSGAALFAGGAIAGGAGMMSGGGEASALVCKVALDTATNVNRLCKKPLFAAILGMSICGNTAGTVKDSARTFTRHRESLDEIARETRRYLRNSGSAGK